jgi:hypothetical protein
MTNTKSKLAFVWAMGRHSRATVRQCEALMRYAATLQRLAEDDCNYLWTDVQERKRRSLTNKAMELCCELDCVAIFSSDPRGAVLKIRVPSGYSDSFGGEGIVVPS